MSAIITPQFRIQNAQAFIDDVLGGTFYMAIGRVTPWGEYPAEGEIAQTDLQPPFPAATSQVINLLWRDLIAGKKIQSDRVQLTVQRWDWESGEVYSRYESNDEALFRRRFYVLTDEYNIYKCIDNSDGGPSTDKPDHVQGLETYSDGYVWAYMGSISIDDVNKFLTEQHMPVRLPGGYTAPTTGGPIHTLSILDGGSGYSVGDSITVSGDGIGFAATVSALGAGNQISEISISNQGSGYNWADVVVTSTAGEDAVIQPNIQPRGGHGHNIQEELGQYYVTVNVPLLYDEDGAFTVQNDYRKIAIMSDLSSSSQDLISFTTQIDVQLTVPSTEFTPDEIVTNGTGATARVVDFVPQVGGESGVLRVVRVQGTFSQSDTISGETSIVEGTINSVTDSDVTHYVGKVHYIENRRPILRSADQVEELRITIEW